MEKKQYPLNPWSSIWTRPRQTLRGILETNPYRLILLIAIVEGIVSALVFLGLLKTQLPYQREAPKLIAILVLAIIGIISGIIHLYLGGWLYRVTGSWLGGKGSFTDVKCAVGWGQYPFIIANLLAFFSYLSVPNLWLQVIFGILNFIVAIWAIVIFLHLIAEAHRFSSAWQALGAVLIAAVLVFIAVIIVVMIVAALIPLISPLFAN